MVKLNETETAQANCVAENIIKGLCIGGAKLLKGTGTVVKFTTDATAGVLRGTANLVEKGGNTTSGFCFEKADSLTERANKANAKIDELMAAIENAETETDTVIATVEAM